MSKFRVTLSTSDGSTYNEDVLADNFGDGLYDFFVFYKMVVPDTDKDAESAKKTVAIFNPAFVVSILGMADDLD